MSVFLIVELYNLFTIVSKSMWYIVWKTREDTLIFFPFFFLKIFVFSVVSKTIHYIKANSKSLVVNKYSLFISWIKKTYLQIMLN